MFIAQLTDGIVTSVVQTVGVKTDANHIEISQMDASLLGCTYKDGAFIPPALPTVQEDPALWLIDVQPFVERFGAAEFSISKGTTDGAKMFNASMARSNWVNLKSESLQGYMSLLYVEGYITEAQMNTILHTPVAPIENAALRKNYFGGSV